MEDENIESLASERKSFELSILIIFENIIFEKIIFRRE